MTVRLNPDSSFAQRPEIGDRYLCHTTKAVKIVAASWQSGVVFEGGEACSAMELLTHYDPQCQDCKAFHEPEYPHELTPAFRLHIQWSKGRKATQEDTFAHCSGTLLAAVSEASA